MLWSNSNKAKLYYCSSLCINLVLILALAISNEGRFGYHIIADGGRAIIVIDREGVEINYCLL